MPYKDAEKQRQFQREWAKTKRQENPEWNLAQTKGRKVKLAETINQIKATTPCADCGGTFHPVCMDFDHRDPLLKVSGISEMIQARLSLDTIMKEIDKCDLVCANCHRLRTYVI